jgi:hypothetical protein
VRGVVRERPFDHGKPAVDLGELGHPADRRGRAAELVLGGGRARLGERRLVLRVVGLLLESGLERADRVVPLLLTGQRLAQLEVGPARGARREDEPERYRAPFHPPSLPTRLRHGSVFFPG